MSSALITGTSTGIGLETALLFARRGVQVFAGARDPGASAGLQKGIAEGLPIVPLALDVDSDESVGRAVAQVTAAAGPVDVLVNNAGIGGGGPVEMMPLDMIRALFETNVFGGVRLMQAVLPAMRARRSGAVINISSVMGRITLPGHGYYAATKSAIAALTETLAMEVRPLGIRVASIEPGVILTPIWKKAGDTRAAVPDVPDYLVPRGRLMRIFGAQMEGGTPPEAVAEAVWRAATEDGPVHVTVGDDADVLVAAHARARPDQWVSIFAEPDEQRFADRLNDLCGEDMADPPSLNARRRRPPA